GAPLFPGFFLISGQRFCFHSRIFSSSRSSARPTGRWQLQPNCRRMRQACEAWYGIAGIAAPALNAALTEVSKPLAGLMLTFEAGHLISPLALCGETSQNICGSEAWVTPRFGLAPTPVSAEAGAFNQQLVNRWGARHRFLPAFLKRPAVQEQSVSHLTAKSFTGLLNPSETRLAALVSRLLNVLVQNPIYHGVNRGHHISVFAQVIAHTFKLVFHVKRNKVPAVILLKRSSYRVSKTQFIFSNILLAESFCESRSGLLKADDLILQCIYLRKTHAKL